MRSSGERSLVLENVADVAIVCIIAVSHEQSTCVKHSGHSSAVSG